MALDFEEITKHKYILYGVGGAVVLLVLYELFGGGGNSAASSGNALESQRQALNAQIILNNQNTTSAEKIDASNNATTQAIQANNNQTATSLANIQASSALSLLDRASKSLYNVTRLNNQSAYNLTGLNNQASVTLAGIQSGTTEYGDRVAQAIANIQGYFGFQTAQTNASTLQAIASTNASAGIWKSVIGAIGSVASAVI